MRIEKSLPLENVKPYLLKNATIRSLSRVLFSIPVSRDRDYPDYAYTTGTHIYVGDRFFQEPGDCQGGIILHEILHIVLLHCKKSRLHKRKRELWNFVMEPIVNSIILSVEDIRKHVSIPECGYTFDKEPFREALNIKRDLEWTTESLYEWALNRGIEAPPDFKLDIIFKSSPEEEVKKHTLERFLPGTIAGIESYQLKSFLQKEYPKTSIPWDQYLKRYAKHFLIGKIRYDYNRPSRQYLAEVSHYEPSRRPRLNLKLAVLVDTSGSCFNKVCQEKFISVIEDIRREANPEIHLLTADTVVHQEMVINPMERKPLTEIIEKFLGGGGTDYKEAVEKIVKIKPHVAVGLTDGWVNNWGNPQSIPFIWVCTGTASAPYGITLKID